jgi:DNA-binding HxlR family transcriptional regulator
VRYDDLADTPCSITRPLVVFGDRWTLLVLKASFTGVRRFNAFQTEIGISRSRLQDRLTRLVEHGILAKRQAADGDHTEYRLTRKGHDIYPILMAIRDWGDTYMAPDGPPVLYRHRNCTGEGHVALTCDSCGTGLAPHDIVPEPGSGLSAAGTTLSPSESHSV